MGFHLVEFENMRMMRVGGDRIEENMRNKLVRRLEEHVKTKQNRKIENTNAINRKKKGMWTL